MSLKIKKIITPNLSKGSFGINFVAAPKNHKAISETQSPRFFKLLIAKFRITLTLSLFIVLMGLRCLYAQPRVEITTAEESTEYLRALAKDTWANIDFYVAPKTGFPYDTDQKGDMTNTTNIGLYLTSLAAATEMGFISRGEASKKARKVLTSLEKLQHWKGFFVNWISVKGIRKAGGGINALSDFNKLSAGLIIVRREFPELSDKCTALLNRMDWSIFYDRGSKALRGGFDVANKQLSSWNIKSLAADTRLAVFLAIATGGAPAEAWNSLNRDTEEHYGLKILTPSWYGGGMYMQGICGLFLDERETVVGKSMADFAYAQMLYAREINSPVWGWSSSTSPWGDFLGWGRLRANIITPHASALAIIYYPDKVVENLKNLEKYGSRADFEINEKKYAFGFRDAVDIDTNKTSYGYITALDQGMLFLSLVNYLKDGLIWKLFERDPIVKKGKELLNNYFSSRPTYREIYRNRDKTSFEPLRRGGNAGLATLIVDDFSPDSETNKFGGRRFANGCAISITKVEKDPQHGNSLEISFDLTRVNPNYFSEELNSLDLSRYNALSFYIKGDRKSKFTHSLRIELEGKDNGAAYRFIGITDKWQRVIIPLREFGGSDISCDPGDTYWGGFLTDRTKMKRINFVFDLDHASVGRGRIRIAGLGFDNFGDADFKRIAFSLNNFPASPIWDDNVLDNFDTSAGWNSVKTDDAPLSIAVVAGKEGKALQLRYSLGAENKSRWVAIEKEAYFTLPDQYIFKFFVNAEGNANILEFKLIDANGSTFGKKIDLPPTAGEWKEVSVDSRDISYLWGGDKKLDRINKISFAISAKSGGMGKITIDDLRFFNRSLLTSAGKTAY